MTNDPTWHPKVSARMRAQRMDDQSIWLDEENERVHQLNEVGTFILDRCDGTRTADEIAQEIVARWEVPPQEARADVTGLLERMKALGIVN